MYRDVAQDLWLRAWTRKVRFYEVRWNVWTRDDDWGCFTAEIIRDKCREDGDRGRRDGKRCTDDVETNIRVSEGEGLGMDCCHGGERGGSVRRRREGYSER